jgi:hypothetical protein
MRQADPRSLGNEELEQACAKTSLEGLLEIVALLALVTSLPLLLLGTLAQAFGLGFAGAVLVALAAFGVLRLLTRHKHALREERNFRRGLAPLERYMNEARNEVALKRVDWVVLFAQRSLPHGPHRWMRASVTAGPPACAVASLRVTWQSQARAAEADRQIQAELGGETARELAGMLSGTGAASLTDIPSFVFDGAPCRVAIVEREAEGTGGCNLGGLREEQQELPTVALCRKLASIARELQAGR